MRRALVIVLSSAAVAAALASTSASCTTFDGLGYDASAGPGDDGAGGDDAGAAPTGYLSIEDAEIVCSVASKEPALDVAIGISIAVPLRQDTPQFSACVSWLSRGVTSKRRGFALQQGMLQRVRAAAPSSSAMVQACFIGVTLGNGCSTTMLSCSSSEAASLCAAAGHLEISCSPPTALAGSSCSAPTISAPCTRASTTCPGPPFCGDNGDFAIHCTGNVESGNDCSRTGLACANGVCTDPSDPAVCASGPLGDLAAECAMPDAGAGGATATVAHVCISSQPRVSIDCAAAGLVCMAASGTVVCASPSDECTPETAGIDTCTDATTLAACIGGKRTAIDCTKLGTFTKCVATPAAHCE